MGAAKKKGGSQLTIPVRVKSKSGDCFEELNSFMACMAVRLASLGRAEPPWLVVVGWVMVAQWMAVGQLLGGAPARGGW